MIQRITDDWKEVEYDFGTKEELEERHPSLFPIEDDNEYMVIFVTDDNDNEYDLNSFLRHGEKIECEGKEIEIAGFYTTSNFGGVGIELTADAYRLYNIWS